jgi:hypothetical protein
VNATLETPYDERFIAQKHEALRQQGISLLTIQVEPEDVMVDRRPNFSLNLPSKTKMG